MQDLYKIDPNYGTSEELRRLSDELHKRDMVFIYDIVLNHMGPVTLFCFMSFKPDADV